MVTSTTFLLLVKSLEGDLKMPNPPLNNTPWAKVLNSSDVVPHGVPFGSSLTPFDIVCVCVWGGVSTIGPKLDLKLGFSTLIFKLRLRFFTMSLIQPNIRSFSITLI